LQLLQNAPDIADKVRRVFARPQQPESATQTDAELAIYNGFCGDSDRRLCAEVRRTPAAELTRNFGFRDARFTELLFRYRARNYPQTLDVAERARWDEFRRTRLTRETPLAGLTLDRYLAEIAALRSDGTNNAAKSSVLDQLELWGRDLAATL
jgi:exodeoxyribonuclease-1